MNAVQLEDVCFRYFPEGKRNILDHVNLTLCEGGITVLTGNSGSGKSTLAAVIAGLYPSNGGVLTGAVRLFGKEVKELRPKERARTLTMMFQNPDLQFCMDTLRKELQFCMGNLGVPQEEMEKRLQCAAKTLGMEEKLDQKLFTLSGGEKQKAALCCLLALDGKILILDEALANIDTASARQIIAMMRQLADEGKTILAIDHRPELWENVADRFLVWGTTEEAPVVRGEKKTALRQAIVLEDVTICREYPLLEHCSASFPQGCMTAILGESGSGKTTLFLSMLRQYPYEGTITVNGIDLRKVREKQLFSQMGVVFQNPGNQFITQNVLQEVQTSLRIWKKQGDAEKLLEEYGLLRYKNYSPYMLSQGQQRRLAVLSVLAGGQQILLLDEPTYGQDRATIRTMMEQLKEKTQQGLTVIFITHDERLAETWADQIYRLEGRKLCEA